MTAQRKCHLIVWAVPQKKKNIVAQKREGTVLEVNVWNMKKVDPTSKTQEPKNKEN